MHPEKIYHAGGALDYGGSGRVLTSLKVVLLLVSRNI